MRRLIARAILILAAMGAALAAYSYREATAMPLVRRAELTLADWPAGAPPLRLVLISDIHIGTAAMDQHRLERIVGQIDALHPDLVLIAGDFIFGHDPRGAARLGEAMIGPLSRLRPRLGTVAVLGNHDWWTGVAAVREQLARAHITVLDNQAMAIGPLALGGIADDFSGRADLWATMRALRALPGAHVLMTHSPDIAPDLPPDAPLLLAGHTHCGQVMLPFYGPISDVSRYHARYRCGLTREGAHTVIVTGGLGTSGAPFRLRAPPDLWLITLRGRSG